LPKKYFDNLAKNLLSYITLENYTINFRGNLCCLGSSAAENRQDFLETLFGWRRVEA